MKWRVKVVVAASIQGAAVASLGALAAAATYAASEYFRFLGLVVRLVASGARWSGGPALSSVLAGPDSGAIVAAFALGAALQAACCAAAVRVHRRAHALDAAQTAVPAAPGGARGRARLAWALIAASVLALAGYVALVLRVVQASLARVHAASTGGAVEGQLATQLAEGYRGVVQHPLAGLVLALPQLALAFVAWAFALAAAQRCLAAERASALAASDPAAARAWGALPGAPVRVLLASATVLAAVGLLPAIGASVWHFAEIADAFDTASRLDPVERVPVLVAGLEAAKRGLAFWTRVALTGIALATALAIAAAVVQPLRRRRALAAGSANAAQPIALAPAAIALCALLASGALVRLTAPYRAENALPVGSVAVANHDFVPDLPVPALTAPDAVAVAPLLELGGELVTLDRRPAGEPEPLREELATIRRNWSILHPGDPQLDTVLFACAREAELGPALPALRAAHAAGFTHLQLIVGRWVAVARPVLGDVEHPQFSAATAALVLAGAGAEADASAPAPAPGTAQLALDPRQTCASFARELTALRVAGRNARVVVPP